MSVLREWGRSNVRGSVVGRRLYALGASFGETRLLVGGWLGLLAGGDLGLVLLAEAVADEGSLVDPVGAAGVVVEEAGGDWAVENDVGELEDDHGVGADLIGNRCAVVRDELRRFKVTVFDAVGKEIGLTDEQ